MILKEVNKESGTKCVPRVGGGDSALCNEYSKIKRYS